MAAKSRTKGSRAENDAIRFLWKRFGVEYAKHREPGQGYMTKQDGVDLVPAEGELPDIQVKDYADFSLFRWLKDPYAEAGRHKGKLAAGLVWLVKAPRQGWLVVGEFDDLMKFVAADDAWYGCDGLGVACFGF